MAIKTTQEQGGIISDINITPLTDVMLVLLIIFMVTATFFVSEPALQVNLPSAVTSQPEPQEGNEITVIVNESGKLFVNDEAVTTADLTQALMKAAREIPNEQKVVVVRGDKQASYGAIIWVMDAARLVGLRNVSLATEETPETTSARPQN